MGDVPDRIVIGDLLVRCIIGVTDSERRDKQDVLINLAIYTDLSQSGTSDRIEDTVDYRVLKKGIIAMAESSTFHLEEALAHAVAALCLEHKRVQRVDVRVEKPGALRFARTVAVEISRHA